MLLPLLPLLATMAAEAQPVTVELYDVNHNESATIQIGRDGSVDRKTAVVIKHLFRCKRTDRQHMIAKPTLAMFADVAAHWPGHVIEVVSGYRAMHRESRTSPHRAARAIDFRIRGVSTIPVRDYMWTNFKTVGVGWYPSGRYLHLDSRPGLHDTAWTFRHGKNRYRPSWAEKIRPAFVEEPGHAGSITRPDARSHRATRSRGSTRTHEKSGKRSRGKHRRGSSHKPAA